MDIIDPLVKPRVLVLSDIGNEPDDQQSLVRLVTYANEFDIEGLIPTTSMWQRDKIRPDLMEKVINAYEGSPRENLMIHTGDTFPTGDELLSLIKHAQSKYGMKGVGEGQDSEGSDWIIKIVDKPDPRPLWIPIWGGPNCLAQALWKVRNTRSPAKLNAFIRKIRVFAITEQDDSSMWIRRSFPNLFFIISPFHGVPDSNLKELNQINQVEQRRLVAFLEEAFINHRKAAWAGISGELFYRFKGGPNSELITNRWLKENIRKNHGPLGEVYPRTKYGMETDTSSYLNLIPNGLRSSQSPTFGGWGGRYRLYQPEGEPRPIFTDSEDTVIVGDGFGEIKGDVNGIYTTSQATIWRWREGYQHDFAARMDWASTPNIKEANHPPSVVIQGELDRFVEGKDIILLDATGTSDPDGDKLFFYWFHYKEAGRYDGDVNIKSPSSLKTTLSFKDPKKSGTVHIILDVKDNGNPCLHRYARIILNVIV
ncbi:MAG: DUF1593 domain-containing protein [Candidatus Hodarchaeota archaeon]